MADSGISTISSSSLLRFTTNSSSIILSRSCLQRPGDHQLKTPLKSDSLFSTGMSPKSVFPDHCRWSFLGSHTFTYLNYSNRNGVIRIRCQRTEQTRGKTFDNAEMVECVGTGSDVECIVVSAAPGNSSDAEEQDDGRERDDESSLLKPEYKSNQGSTTSSFPFSNQQQLQKLRLFSLEIDGSLDSTQGSLPYRVWDSLLLISPFFFWGTAMVAMKEVLPKAGPLFVSAFRLIPAGALLVAFATLTRRKQPSGFEAWLSILLFAAVDATCFQGFLARGLEKTSAGLGSVFSCAIILLH